MLANNQLRKAFMSVAGGDTVMDKAELGRLLQMLHSDRTITQNDVLFALKEIDLTQDGRVSYVEFRKWYAEYSKGHRGSSFNKLLVKDMVGKSRTSSYDLPSKQFTFGKVVPRDVNDAKEVIQNWQSGKQRVSGSELLKSRNTKGAPSKGRIYGHVNRPSTPMGKLIQGEFAGPAAEAKETEYPERPTHVSVKRRAEQTMKERRAVAMAAERGKHVRRAGQEVTNSTWKMKKFSHVKPKLNKSGQLVH